MSRKPRIISSSGIYHIILRSINQQQLFEEDEDFKKFLYVMSEVQIKYPFELYAYCLMGNHVHLLMANLTSPLKTIFQSIGARFVAWYNKKYERFGHLFQERFISKPVESEAYFLSVLQYIQENPVRAGICAYPSNYPWSSCQAYYGAKNRLVTKEPAIRIAGSSELLQQYFHHHSCDSHSATKPLSPSDQTAKQLILSLSGCTNPSDFQHMQKVKRNNYIILFSREGLSPLQIARLCGISRTTVYRILNRNKTPLTNIGKWD